MKALNRFEEALNVFDSALKIREDYYPAIRGRIDVLQSLNRFEEAIESAKAAVKLRPDEPDVLSNLAFTYLKAGLLNEAIETYEAAIAKGDNTEETRKLYSSVLSQKAVELDKQGDLVAAESLYDKAIETDASESKLFNRAYLYLRTDRADLAQTEFLKVTDINPQHGAVSIRSATHHLLPSVAIMHLFVHSLAILLLSGLECPRHPYVTIGGL